MILAAFGCEIRTRMKMCLSQVHTSHSVCTFEACFFQLTLEYMDFLRSLIFFFEGGKRGGINNDHTKFKMIILLAMMGVRVDGESGYLRNILCVGMFSVLSLVPSTLFLMS